EAGMDLDPGTGGLLDEGADAPGLVAGEVMGHRPAGRPAQRVLGVDLLGRGVPLDRVESGLAVAMREALLEQPGGAGMVLARAGPEDAPRGFDALPGHPRVVGQPPARRDPQLLEDLAGRGEGELVRVVSEPASDLTHDPPVGPCLARGLGGLVVLDHPALRVRRDALVLGPEAP